MSQNSFSVFVYGTLKPGGHYWAEFCEGKVSSAIPAKIHGRLYDLHLGYPGVILGGDAWVEGYVLTFEDEKYLIDLDRLEGFSKDRSPHLNEYNRLRVPYYSSDGLEVGMSWIYEITEKTIQSVRMTWIENGNWPV